MAAAGDYDVYFQWFAWSLGSADGFGARPDVYTTAGNLWGLVENHTAGTTQVLESSQQVDRATVRLRNYPGVKTGDRLVCTRFELPETWTVTDARRALNEVVCDVERDPVSRYPGLE